MNNTSFPFPRIMPTDAMKSQAQVGYSTIARERA